MKDSLSMSHKKELRRADSCDELPSEKIHQGNEEFTPKFSQFIRGSDPRIATCRGKLQNKRSKLNQEINKELRLRAGAENLFKATTNRKLRETVALELSFVNSNLQLLKEQLAELNSSVELYQNQEKEPVMPMVPLGLKETKEIDLMEPFKDFILEHYSEDASLYEDAITELMDLRQAMRTPLRDLSGISLLFQYYNQLYFVERRFFPPDRSLGIYFEWFDSLTGVPSCQRTVAFEKACVLFNMAALHTQIGAKQDRKSVSGLDSAIDHFLRAAGVFKYICDNFTNAPSMDLNSEMLDMLGKLMLAQARECLLEKLLLEPKDYEKSPLKCLELSQEASNVAESYKSVLKFVHPVREYIPFSWSSLMSVKQEYYTALAHRFCANAVLFKPLKELPESCLDVLKHMMREPDGKTQLDIRVPVDDEERLLLGKSHLRESILRFEEAQRHHRMCRDLKNKPGLETVLRNNHAQSLESFSSMESENDFRDILDPPAILPLSKYHLTPHTPDFSEHRVTDLFRRLGPCAVFSAKHHWTAPRLVNLIRMSAGFGFTVRGASPVIVAAVESASLAERAGMKEGDLIVAIGDEDVKWCPHEQVVELIKKSGDILTLKLVTPMDKTYINRGLKNQKNGSVSGSSSSSGVSSSSWNGNQSGHSTVTSTLTTSSLWSVDRHVKKLTWNPFKKHSNPALDILR